MTWCSPNRARARADLAAGVPAQGVTGAKKVDHLTVDVVAPRRPTPCCPKVHRPRDDDRTWCQKNGVEKAQDFNGKEETFAVRNANSTGPFRHRALRPDVRTVLKANPAWWGRATSATATSTR